MGSNIFLAYIIRRKPIKMGLDQGDALQIHCSPPSNKIVLHGPALKRYSSLQDDSFQEIMVQLTREHDSL